MTVIKMENGTVRLHGLWAKADITDWNGESYFFIMDITVPSNGWLLSFIQTGSFYNDVS